MLKLYNKIFIILKHSILKNIRMENKKPNKESNQEIRIILDIIYKTYDLKEYLLTNDIYPEPESKNLNYYKNRIVIEVQKAILLINDNVILGIVEPSNENTMNENLNEFDNCIKKISSLIDELLKFEYNPGDNPFYNGLYELVIAELKLNEMQYQIKYNFNDIKNLIENSNQKDNYYIFFKNQEKDMNVSNFINNYYSYTQKFEDNKYYYCLLCFYIYNQNEQKYYFTDSIKHYDNSEESTIPEPEGQYREILKNHYEKYNITKEETFDKIKKNFAKNEIKYALFKQFPVSIQNE